MNQLVTLAAVILVAAATASGAAAQQVSRVPRVAILNQGSAETVTGRLAGGEFREGMRSLGWIEDRTFSIEERFADGDPARLAADAAQLAADKDRRHRRLRSDFPPLPPAKQLRRSRS